MRETIAFTGGGGEDGDRVAQNDTDRTKAPKAVGSKGTVKPFNSGNFCLERVDWFQKQQKTDLSGIY